jgi:hypothetical protein
MASKAAPAEAPTLRDLAGEVARAVAKTQAELADARARLAEFRGQREQALAAPLAACDVASQLKLHIEKHSKDATDYLRLTIQEMRDRTAGIATVAPETMAVYSPFERGTLPEVLALVLDTDAVVERVLAAVGALDEKIPEGLPLAERRAVVAELDAKIAAAEQTEAALIAGLQSAGIAVSMPTDPVPEPKPGDEKIINGEPCRWVSYTGIAGTYGWMSIAEIEQRAA